MTRQEMTCPFHDFAMRHQSGNDPSKVTSSLADGRRNAAYPRRTDITRQSRTSTDELHTNTVNTLLSTVSDLTRHLYSSTQVETKRMNNGQHVVMTSWLPRILHAYLEEKLIDRDLNKQHATIRTQRSTPNRHLHHHC